MTQVTYLDKLPPAAPGNGGVQEDGGVVAVDGRLYKTWYEADPQSGLTVGFWAEEVPNAHFCTCGSGRLWQDCLANDSHCG